MKSNRTNGCRTGFGAWVPKVAAWALMGSVVGAGTSVAEARPTPPPLEDPAHWATITHSGNAPYAYVDQDGRPQEVGAVNYEYRISKTEVTHREWLEFVNAYAPYVSPQDRRREVFRSSWIIGFGATDIVFPGAEDYAIDVGWRYAARYVNWLHNNKAMNREAFESGVYDTSTFTNNPDGTFNDNRTRAPGARFWIPSEDEWVKAAYFDPHKNGPNQPGYWQYNTTSDTAPIPGPPGVGQTNATNPGQEPPSEEHPVMSYPHVTSPWGLWDMSGGYQEHLEAVGYAGDATLPSFGLTRGSMWALGTNYDHITRNRDVGPPQHGRATIRLATVVPAPSSIGGAVVLGAILLRRCRR